MHNPFRTALFVGIGERTITLLDERQGRAAPGLLQTSWPGGHADAGAQCALQLSQLFKDAKVHRGRVHIVLADALVRYFAVTPPANVSDVRDCEAVVAMRFASLFDEAPTQWHIQADWHLTQPFLACAVPRSLKAGIEEAARAARLTLMGVVPQFVGAWTRWRGRLAPDSWLILAHGSHFTLGIASQQQLKTVRQLPLAAICDDALTRLPVLLKRESLSLDQDMPDQVFIIAPLAGQWAPTSGEGPRFQRLDTPVLDDMPESLREGVALARIGSRT